MLQPQHYYYSATATTTPRPYVPMAPHLNSAVETGCGELLGDGVLIEGIRSFRTIALETTEEKRERYDTYTNDGEYAHGRWTTIGVLAHTVYDHKAVPPTDRNIQQVVMKIHQYSSILSLPSLLDLRLGYTPLLFAPPCLLSSCSFQVLCSQFSPHKVGP